jgi:dihydropteroate synthase
MASGLPRRDDRICVVGVLNVTPDSFSDGGRYTSVDAALEHAHEMHREGADLIDIGGESTRPGAQRIDPHEELRRVLPVIRELSRAGVPMSIDTYRASVAAAALDEGVSVVNDVSGGLADPDMATVVRDAGCPWILMHWRGHSEHMQDLATYDDVVKDVRTELLARVDAAVAGGVDERQLVIDPGLGFAKTAAHNWTLLAALDSFVELGLPVLVASSRKSFLGRLLASADGTPRPVDDRAHRVLRAARRVGRAGARGPSVRRCRPRDCGGARCLTGSR